MTSFIKREGYTFEEIQSIDIHRPYRVKCIETGETKDSAISFEDAINLLLGPMKFAISSLHVNSLDKEYVQKVFSEALIGKKKSNCNEIVENEIVERKVIEGIVYEVPEKEKFEPFKEYLTEHFIVRIDFGHGLFAGATKVSVENRS